MKLVTTLIMLPDDDDDEVVHDDVHKAGEGLVQEQEVPGPGLPCRRERRTTWGSTQANLYHQRGRSTLSVMY